MGELQVNCGDMKFPEKSVGPITYIPARQSPPDPLCSPLVLFRSHPRSHSGSISLLYLAMWGIQDRSRWALG